MKNIKIKNTEELRELSKIFNKPVEELADDLIEIAAHKEYIFDDQEDVGRLFIDVFLSTDFITPAGVCVFCPGTHNTKIVDLFSTLILYGTGDCPKCGCDVEITHKKTNGNAARFIEPEVISEFHKCTKCNYSETK